MKDRGMARWHAMPSAMRQPPYAITDRAVVAVPVGGHAEVGGVSVGAGRTCPR